MKKMKKSLLNLNKLTISNLGATDIKGGFLPDTYPTIRGCNAEDIKYNDPITYMDTSNSTHRR